MRHTLLIVAIALSLLASSDTVAQDDTQTYVPPQPAASPPLVQHHASTVEEGALRGWADVGRAIGESRYNTALALVHREEAMRRRLENQQQAVEQYFDLRRYNQNVRFQTAVRPTAEELARVSQSRLPDRLTGAEFQQATGVLVWPVVLQGKAFAAERAAVDAALAARTRENSGVGSISYREVRAATSAIESKLRDQADQLSTTETITARKFLASLNYEVRFSLDADIAGLAAK